EDVWCNRAAVSKLLTQLAAIQFPSESSLLHTRSGIFNRDFTSAGIADGLIEGEFSVQNTLYQLLSSEISQQSAIHFQMLLPFETDISPILIQLWHNTANFSVDHLFCFPSVSDNDFSKSLERLQQIIPLCLIARESYHPYYFYENSDSVSVNPLYYYIITPHYLVLLSQDQSTALIQTSERLINYYSNYFLWLMDHSEPLVSVATTLSDILKVSGSMIDPKGSLSIMPQPCFARYSTPEMIEKYFQVCNSSMQEITPDIPLDMYDSVINHFTLVQTIEKNFHSVFSEKGIMDFIETGRITEMPSEYVHPIDIPDRIHFLNQLRNDIANDKVVGRIEKSVCHAFQDFFQSLPGSQLIHTKEETLRILDDGIRELLKQVRGTV
ncbi:MAG: hypothetical protein LUH07_16030, partial [Lachnospiraceae bacterium]|nr:hypothetical protein [Lachnospiraceae bacterium]